MDFNLNLMTSIIFKKRNTLKEKKLCDMWNWLDNLINDVYFDNYRRSYGIPLEMVLCLPLLIIWWVWKKIKKD